MKVKIVGCFVLRRINPFSVNLIKAETIQFSISTIFCLHAVKYQNNYISYNSFKHKVAV